MSDAINPDHYKRLPVEAIEIIESAIQGAPSVEAAYLHGQVLKYVLRCWSKNGIEDLRKAKWYLDRLVDSFDESEQKEAAWTPKIGDWVKITKPDDTHLFGPVWVGEMDKYDGQIIEVKEIIGGGIVQDRWGFLFDWLQPVEPTLYSDKMPEGYRKLKDSSEEPRQLGDLRWSVSERRYVEITVDEIGYANRDNWAACRKIETPSNNPTANPDDSQLPVGYRWLARGEKFIVDDLHINRRGEIGPIAMDFLGDFVAVERLFIRRIESVVKQSLTTEPPCTEVTGEPEAEWIDAEAEWIDAVWPQDWGKPARFWPNPIYQDEGTPDHKLWDLGTIAGYVSDGYRKWIIEMNGKISCQMYCQVKKKVGTLEQSPEPPDGWRFLEFGEVLRKGDNRYKNFVYWDLERGHVGDLVSDSFNTGFIRRNRFEVGEKVIDCRTGAVSTVQHTDKQYPIVFLEGVTNGVESKHLAPYIEVTE